MNTIYINASNAVEIYSALEKKIRAGELPAGAVLPAIRELAQNINVSPNTVAIAYAKLRDAGLVVADGRRGTKVALPPSHADISTVLPVGLYDLASGNVDGALLPSLQALKPFHQTALTGYDMDSDDESLLSMARQYLNNEHLPYEALGVFSGTLDAMAMALRTRVLPGAKIWVESPCWPPLLALLASLRLKPIPLIIDHEGCQIPQPDKQVTAIIITPRAHNPTGVTYSPQRINLLLSLLKQQPNTLLILDDYWGELSHATLPLSSAMPDNWLSILSVSKFLGPDLRTAIVSGSPAVIADMRRQQTLEPRWVSLLLQKLAAQLWQYSKTHSILHNAREVYTLKRRTLLQHLQALGIDIPITGEGLHIWLPVLNEINAVQTLAAKGWGVQAGSPFLLHSQSAIRISIGNTTLEMLPTLAQDIAASLSTPKRSWI